MSGHPVLNGTSRVSLPNGWSIAHRNGFETKATYDEVFEQRIYGDLAHSVTADEWLVDIGANIGLFTLQAWASGMAGRVLAVEPIASTFEALQANLRAYEVRADSVRCAVADRCGMETVTTYNGYSVGSGLHGTPSAATAFRATVVATLEHVLRMCPVSQATERARLRAWRDEATQLQPRARNERVDTITLSELVTRYAIDRVGLLKIDIEGAELLALAGIADDHWGRIRQIVIETHGPRLRDEVVAHLRPRGFVVDIRPHHVFADGSAIVSGVRDEGATGIPARRPDRRSMVAGDGRQTVVVAQHQCALDLVIAAAAACGSSIEAESDLVNALGWLATVSTICEVERRCGVQLDVEALMESGATASGLAQVMVSRSIGVNG